jgi:hypothetical protein
MAYKRDLLMRILTDFLQKLEERLSVKKISEISDPEMNGFYVEFFSKNRDFIISLDSDSLLEECKTENAVSVEKVRILSELLYIEAQRYNNKVFAEKSLFLFNNYNQKTKIYDFGIINKIERLTQIIESE